MINEMIFILKSAIITIVHAERSDYCVTLDSSILMFHWVRPFTVVFFVVSMFCLSMLCRSPVQRL